MIFRLSVSLVLLSSFGLLSATTYFQDAPELPKEEEALWKYANEKSNSRNWKEGVRAYRQYTTSFPEGKYIDQAYMQMGNQYIWRARRYVEARAVFEEYCTKFPKGSQYWQARFRISQSWQRQGMKAEAIDVL